MKKVILLLIDSLMDEHLQSAITSETVPALQYLVNNGVYNKECVTVFPTMTATIDASLITGLYPDQHKIPGLIWYSSEEKRLINYANGSKTVFKLGISSVIKDALINLNEKHLNKKIKTIYEDLNSLKKTSASINFIIHRGPIKHQLDIPFLINLLSGFKLNKAEISGPDILCKGSFCKPRIRFRKIKWSINQSILKKYGVNDNFSADVAEAIIIGGIQPDLMMIYLPDHDHNLHKNIDNPLSSLEKVDKQISRVLNAYGSWREAINQNIFIVIGDHGQTKIENDNKYNIDLDKLLINYKVLRIGKKAYEKDDVAVANNERMAYVYPLRSGLRKSVLKNLLIDNRIDFIAWKQGEKIKVVNSQGKQLIFSRYGKYVDSYGQKWNIEGEFDFLDLRVEGDNVNYYNYPDVLSRLYGALFSQKDFVYVLSAKPSYEFVSKTFPRHLGGGSHGSLHRTDSIVPLIVAGTDINPKQNMRITDLKEYILQLLSDNSAITG